DGEQAGCQRRRKDVGDVVAEQQRADHAVAHREQPVDASRLAAAMLLQPQHAGTRGAGQRCLARGEECRDQQTRNYDGERQPVHGSIQSSLRARNSRTTPGSTSLVMNALPSAFSKMNVNRPRLTFLSCAISSINASA